MNMCRLQSAIPIAISRVNQVDAGRLDIEMSAMLKEQLVKVFSVMKVYHTVIYMFCYLIVSFSVLVLIIILKIGRSYLFLVSV